MVFMKHSYSLEQLLDYGYQDLCDSFFKLCKDRNDRNILKEILYNGEYNGFIFSSNILNKDDPFLEINRRLNMAYIFLTNPDTFMNIVKNKINMFHGTNSNALPKIIKYGLNSYSESLKNNIDVNTGEMWSRFNDERSFVSFTDILDIAESYALCEENDKLFFEVIIGTSVEGVFDAGKCTISSDIPEVGVRDKLPVQNIKAIFVPNDKVEFVKNMIDDNNILVLSISDFNPRFYYSYDNNEIINFLNNCDINENNNKKIFKLDEIKNMVSMRISKLKNRIDVLRETVVGDELDNDGKKFK